MLAALFTACSPEMEILPPVSQTIHFSVTMDPFETATRALSENGTTIAASWEKGEEIALVYSVNGVSQKSTGTVTDVVDGKATIKAELVTGVTDGAEVSVIYPASAVDESSFDVNANLLTTQDGSLESISKDLDVRTGSGTLAISANNTASFGTAPTLNAKFAICKFNIKSNDVALNVDKLLIASNSTLITTVTPAAATSTLYVAMKPSKDPMTFIATANGSTYLASATAKLTAGHFYKPAMNMKLNVPGENANWMAEIPGDSYIGNMSIPGAHAATCKTLTQDLTIEALWNAGVRAFDIHTEMVGDELRCKFQGLSSMTVDGFFGEIARMLAAHPDEFALVLVYDPVQEYNITDENSSVYKWIKAFRDVLKEYYSCIWDDFFSRTILKNVRGKIVLLSRPAYYSVNQKDMQDLLHTYPSPEDGRAPIGGFCLDWNNDVSTDEQKKTQVMNKQCATGGLWTQDYCDVKNPDDKKSAIANMMDAAISDRPDWNSANPPFVLNYTSANASSADGYRSNAGNYNLAALGKLNGLDGSNGVGVVFMDYAGVDYSEGKSTYGALLVQKLIDRNPKKQ